MSPADRLQLCDVRFTSLLTRPSGVKLDGDCTRPRVPHHHGRILPRPSRELLFAGENNAYTKSSFSSIAWTIEDFPKLFEICLLVVDCLALVDSVAALGFY